MLNGGKELVNVIRQINYPNWDNGVTGETDVKDLIFHRASVGQAELRLKSVKLYRVYLRLLNTITNFGEFRVANLRT